MSPIRGIAVATALLATIASTLSVYPHQLAYFNEAAGGANNGHAHLLHSNLDYGQDFLYFQQWYLAQPTSVLVQIECRGYSGPLVALYPSCFERQGRQMGYSKPWSHRLVSITQAMDDEYKADEGRSDSVRLQRDGVVRIGSGSLIIQPVAPTFTSGGATGAGLF